MGREGREPATALPVERMHAVLRGMSHEDWNRLKELLLNHLTELTQADIEVLERLFRRREPIGGFAGGTVLQVMQAIRDQPVILDELKQSRERIRERIRFALESMSDERWHAFRQQLQRFLTSPAREDDIRVTELAFRTGESVSNIEVASASLAARLSGRKLIDPEVARHNALVRVGTPGVGREDPERAYQAAREALDEARSAEQRARSTVACRFVGPSASFRHARHTVFKMVDGILENQELIGELDRIAEELKTVKPVERETMRWALHRMPRADRLSVIRWIPLNTILMFQEGETAASAPDASGKAIRDRRLAYDLFVRGHSDEELMAAYGLSRNALKNAVGTMLYALLGKPLARQKVLDYLAVVESFPPMAPTEVRRRMKQLSPARRAEILGGIPPCAWKVREVMPLQKHLFLDYLSGEWVLGALVDYYNLQKDQKLTGKFKFEGHLTVRGAHAAITGILSKIAAEPQLRQQLRHWTSPGAFPLDREMPPAAADSDSYRTEDLLPSLPFGDTIEPDPCLPRRAAG